MELDELLRALELVLKAALLLLELGDLGGERIALLGFSAALLRCQALEHAQVALAPPKSQERRV